MQTSTDNIHELRPALARRCEAEIARLGLAQVRAAKRIGVSGPTLNQWINGKYPGNVPAVEAKVRRWLETEEEVEANSLADAPLGRHVPLGITEEISATIAYAHATGDIVTVIGPSGMGKTWAAERYCTKRSSAYYALMRYAAARTLHGMLGVVGRAVGVAQTRASAAALEADIIDELAERRAVLVIDEAQFLTPGMLEALRSIRDGARCGLVLAGEERLKMSLAQRPAIGGRTGGNVTRKHPARADVDAMVSNFLERPAARREVDIAAGVAGGKKGFHALARVMERAWRLARFDGRDAVTAGDLESAALHITSAESTEAGARAAA